MDDPATFPELAIRTTLFAIETCAICERAWENNDLPYAYTTESMEADRTQIVCDYCVEKHYPGLFEQLLSERQYFWAN
jgi:hypothetical protein